jgi:lysophospholipase L1-like esterase
MCLDAGSDAYRADVITRLDGYLSVVERLAAEFDALHVRTQDAWRAVLAVYPPPTWCEEPVHPSADGHYVMANALLKTLRF